MNCGNCGAPMELFERRRYYFCRYCGTFRFLDGPETDGVQVLSRTEQTRGCPLCGKPMAKALLDQAHAIEFCEACRGALMPRASFAAVVEQRRGWATGAPGPPVPLDRRELDRRLACPSCRNTMDVHPYYGPGNVVIDTCARCDAVWLDVGELKQIADAPGRDRGSRGLPPAKKDDGVDVLDRLFG